MPPKTPLRYPARYVSETDDPFSAGLAVFGLYVFGSIASTAILVAFYRWQLESPPGLRATVELLAILAFIGAFFAILSLLFVTGAMYVLSGGFSSERSITEVLPVACWAFAPNIVVGPIELAYALFRSERPSSADELLSGIETALLSPLEPVGLLVYLIVTGWTVYILAYGVSEAIDRPITYTASAALIVGIGSIFAAIV